MKQKGIATTISRRFASLINEELKEIIEEIDLCWNRNDITCDEKLRLVLLVLRQTTTPSEDTFQTEKSKNEFMLRFLGLVKTHYLKGIG